MVGISRSLGGSGDPSPVTAMGVFCGMRAAIEKRLDTSSMSGLRVAVQGVGHVGAHLVRHLVEAGAQVTITDIDKDNVKSVVEAHSVEAVAPDRTSSILLS